MKRFISMVVGLAVLTLPVLAMAAPDFNGAWVRDGAKSDPVVNTMYWLTRGVDAGGGRGPGGRGNATAPMTVRQDANSLEVTDPQGAVRKYSLDGKPSTRATDTGIEKATVTASLQGDTLVIGTTQPYGGMPGNIGLEVKEMWSLSADGKTLTITTTRNSAAVQKTSRQVYNRK